MSIEKTTAYVAYGVSLISASIYCFSLGYLDYFSVADYPSWFNSHVFFFSTILNKSIQSIEIVSANRIDLGFSTPVISAVATTAGFLFAEFYKIRSKASEEIKNILKRISNLKAISFSVVLSVLVFVLLLAFKDVFVFAVPVLLVPLGCLYIAVIFFESLESTPKGKSILENTRIDEILTVLIPAMIVWVLPFQAGHIIALNLNPIKSFPKAWSGSTTYSSSDYLVWREEEKGFWLNCKEKVIYGVNNDGHIFFSRSTTVLDNFECK